MMTQVSRRSFLQLAVVSIGATALAACGATGPAELAEFTERISEESNDTTAAATENGKAQPTAGGPVIVGLPTGAHGGDRIALQIESVISDVRAAEGSGTDLQHSLLSITDTGSLAESVQAALDGGKKLDLVYVRDETDLRALDEAGLLVPVQAASRSDRSFSPDDYFPAAIDSASIGGRLAALPIWISPTLMQYNPGAFATAGVSIPDETWDWTQFVESASRLTLRDGAGANSQFGFLLSPFLTPSYMFMWQNGAGVVSGDGKRAIVDRPEAIEAVQFMADLVLKHEVAPALTQDAAEEPPTINFGPEGLYVDGGLVTMLPRTIGGSFGYSIFGALFAGGRGDYTGAQHVTVHARRNQQEGGGGSTRQQQDDHAPGSSASLPLSVLPKGRMAVNIAQTGGMLAVLSSAADAEETWTGLRKLAEALQERGLVPARRSSPEQLMSIDSSLDSISAKAVLDAANSARIATFPQRAAVIKILRNVVDNPVLAGQVTPKEALEQAAEEIDAVLGV